MPGTDEAMTGDEVGEYDSDVTTAWLRASNKNYC